MQIFNVDESGLNLTQHKGKVVADISKRAVHRVVASEKGKNHTVIPCGSASGYCLPPMIIFPRVRISEALKISAPPGSLIAAQKGCVTAELYLRWFHFFLEQIPQSRPVLLTQDGHSSHISLELIDLAKKNDIHLLCLPSHTTHVLQPLDVGVFSSFKHHVGLALNSLVRSSAGHVPTSEDIPRIIAEAWPKSITPVNLMSGFRKTGIHPLNPGCIHDRMTAPSIATEQTEDSQFSTLTVTSSSMSTKSQEHPESCHSLETHAEGSGHHVTKSPLSSLSDAMDSLLMKPHLSCKTKRKQPESHNHLAVCITDDAFVEKLKNKSQKKSTGSTEQGEKIGKTSNSS